MVADHAAGRISVYGLSIEGRLELVSRVDFKSRQPVSIAMHPSGSFLAACGSSGARLFNLHHVGVAIAGPRLTTRRCGGLPAFNGNRLYLFHGETVYAFAARDGRRYSPLGPGVDVNGVRIFFHPDGRFAHTQGDRVKLFQVKTAMREQQSLDYVDSLGHAFSRDGRFLYLSATKRNSIDAYRVGKNGKLTKGGSMTLPRHGFMALHPRQNILYVSEFQGGRIHVFRMYPGGALRKINSIRLDAGIVDIRMSPTGNFMLLTSMDPISRTRRLRILDTRPYDAPRRLYIKEIPIDPFGVSWLPLRGRKSERPK